MSEITRCPKCNSLFSVAHGQPGRSVTCPFCRQSLAISPPPATGGSDKRIVTRGPFPGLMFVCISPAFVLSCISTFAGLGVLFPDRPEVFFGAACGAVAGLMLQLLLCIGLVRGHRLARQATLVLGGLWLLLSVLGILVGAGALLFFWRAKLTDFSTPEQVMPLALLALELIRTGVVAALLLNLGTADTRRYFGLACPSCDDLNGQPADLLFRRVRCPSCRCEWQG